MVSTRSASRQSSSLGEDLPTVASATMTPRAAAKSTTTTTTTSAVAPASRSAKTWAHTPTTTTLAWLAISLPLVLWDTGYVLMRPHTMEGGFLEWPLWLPYRIYARVDYVYGWKAFNAKDGFTAAQATLNAIETVMYLWYAYIYATKARSAHVVPGRAGAVALLVGFSAAVMTLSKTVLYAAHEYYAGFENIGHNTFSDLLMFWIIPNGAWLVCSIYMTWSMGSDIIDGLVTATGTKTE